MTKEIIKEMQDAKANFEINVDGFGVKLKADHCNGQGWILAINALIDRLSEDTKMSYSEIIIMLLDFSKSCKTFVCESKEQMDVMNELYRQQLEK